MPESPFSPTRLTLTLAQPCHLHSGDALYDRIAAEVDRLSVDELEQVMVFLASENPISDPV